MQGLSNRKKSLSFTNEYLHQIHFAVCPYLLEISQGMNTIFTINFQKDNQIVGQLSTMVYPQIDQNRIQLDPLKNIMFFRIFKDKKMNYKWVLYERSHHGKERMTQTVKVNLEQSVQSFIMQTKQARESIARSKSYESRALNNSSKINESNQGLRSTEKLMQFRKQVQNSSASINSSSGMNETQTESKSIFSMKQMKSKFAKSEIQVTYLFCIGWNENQITQKVKSFHLQAKFNIINKSLKKTDNAIAFTKEKQCEQQKLELIQEELQSSQKTSQQLKSLRNSTRNNAQQKMKVLFLNEVNQGKLQLYPQFQGSSQITLNEKSLEDKQKFIHNQTKYTNADKSQTPLPVDSLENQPEQKSLSEVTNRPKVELQPHQSIQNLQKSSAIDKQNSRADLFKTEKTHKKIAFNIEIVHDKELVRTTPVDAISETYVDNHPQKTIIHTEQSYLKLDDVILHGKRVSVSDKSEWMLTSKSKTQDNQLTQKSNQHKKLSNKHENDTKNVQSLNNLQLNSKKDENLSFQIISSKPKQKYPVDDDQMSNDLSITVRTQKQQDKPENMVKLNSILMSDNFHKLKRKSTAEDFHFVQNKIQLVNKPKTMQESTIRMELRTVKDQLKHGGWIDDQQNEAQSELQTPLFCSDRRLEEKYKRKIPSMIDEAVEICKSGDMSKTNSVNEGDPFNNQLDHSYDWGQGLSQIKSDNETQSDNYFVQTTLHTLNNFYELTQPYTEQYIKPIRETLDSNVYYQKVSIFARQEVNRKYFFFGVIVILLFLLLGFTVWNSDPKRMHPNDPIFKKKEPKTKRRVIHKKR